MKTILIVEDDIAIAEFLREMLQDMGYKILRAVNGRDGLQQLEIATPELIMTDMMMPIMNGRQLCMELRADQRYQHIPIILMSAIRPPNLDPELYTHFLPKPFALDTLLTMIEQVLGTHPDSS
jgi:CheY-like chemotaxis protein